MDTVLQFVPLILFVLSVVLAIVLYRILDALADNDIFLTKVEPGQAKFIMRGGTFEEAIMGDRDRVFDHEWNIIKYLSGTKRSMEKQAKELGCGMTEDGRVQRKMKLLERLFGWRWVGLLRKVDEYHFTWTEVKQKDGELSIEPREGDTKFMFVRAFTYGSILKELETADRLPLNVVVLVTAMIINPVKARFRVDDWLQRIMGLIDTSSRRFVSENTYDRVLIEQRNPKSGSDHGEGESYEVGLWDTVLKDYPCEGHAGNHDIDHDSYLEGINFPDKKLLKEIGGDDRCIYFQKYGVLVDVVEILSIEFGGPNAAELVDAATAEYRAEQQAAATVKEAEGEAKALELVAGGEAKRVTEVYKPLSELGPLAVLAHGVDSVSENFGGKGKPGGKDG